MITYGTPDLVPPLSIRLMREVEGLEIAYIIHHQRVDMGSKGVPLAGGPAVQAVLKDRTVVTVRQMTVDRQEWKDERDECTRSPA